MGRTSSSVTLAPEGAYGNVKGQSVFTHGAIIGLSQASSRDLTRESDRMVSGILDGNAYLAVNGKYQRVRIAGRDALRIRLVGNSPVTNRREIVDVYTVLARQDELFSIIQVVPANDQASYRAAFDEMVALLENSGVHPIHAEGQPFDPKYHEAVAHVEGEEGKVKVTPEFVELS